MPGSGTFVDPIREAGSRPLEAGWVGIQVVEFGNDMAVEGRLTAHIRWGNRVCVGICEEGGVAAQSVDPPAKRGIGCLAEPHHFYFWLAGFGSKEAAGTLK